MFQWSSQHNTVFLSFAISVVHYLELRYLVSNFFVNWKFFFNHLLCNYEYEF